MNEKAHFRVLRPFYAYNQDGEVQKVTADVVYAEIRPRGGWVRFVDREERQFDLLLEEFTDLQSRGSIELWTKRDLQPG